MIRHSSRRRSRRRQRGTAYVLVLSITSMLVVMGIAATQIARGELERYELESGQAAARLSAVSLQDMIHKQIDGDMTWRDSATSGAWVRFGTLDGGDLFYRYRDQIDGNMSDDYTEPFLLYTRAIYGESRRTYVIEMIPDDDGEITPNAASFSQVID